MGMLQGGANLPVQWCYWKPTPDSLYYRVVTEDYCAPILDIAHYVHAEITRPVYLHDYYFNIQAPLNDTSVFTPPPYCKQSKEVEVMEGAMREEFLQKMMMMRGEVDVSAPFRF